MNSFRVCRFKFFVGLVFALLCTRPVLSVAQSWVALPNGLALLASKAGGFQITVIRADSRIFDFTVEDVLQDVGGSPTGASGYSYSLAQLSTTLKPIALSNAGATNSFQLPAPVGLLKIKDRISSPLNKSNISGIFCVGADGRARVLATDQASIDKDIESCSYAVQGRPLLVQHEKVASTLLSGIKDFQSARTAIGVDFRGDVLLIIADEISLRDFADRLVQMHYLLGLTDVVNLDGSGSSGLMYQSGNGQSYVEVANTHSLIASAIAIKPKASLNLKKKIRQH
jgi:uncharacterized protein YigE (DUF2233 family)